MEGRLLRGYLGKENYRQMGRSGQSLQGETVLRPFYPVKKKWGRSGGSEVESEGKREWRGGCEGP